MVKKCTTVFLTVRGATFRFGRDSLTMGALGRVAAVAAALASVASAGASAATLSSNPDGDAAVAFQFPREGPGAPVFAVLRPAGGVFGKPTRLTRHAWGADVAVAAGGAAVVAWNESGDGEVRARLREPGRGWGPPVTLAERGDGAAAAIDPSGAALVVWTRPDGTIGSAARPSGGRFEAPRKLPGKGRLQALAMDGAGNAIVLSLLDRPKAMVQSSYRPAGGRFEAPKPVAAAEGAGLAMNAAGDAIAVFPVEGGELAASRRPAGGEFGPPFAVTTGEGRPYYESSPDLEDVGLGGDGTAAVAWTTPLRDGDGNVYGLRAYAALAAGDGSFGTAKRLSTPANPGTVGRVAVDESGDAVVAWGAPGLAVDGAFGSASAAFPTPLRLAGPRLGGFPDVSIASSGVATAVWQQNDGERNEFVARSFGASGPGPAAQVLRSIPAYRHFPHGRARCHPPRTRTLVESRVARVYADLRKDYNTDTYTHYHPKYGCLFQRGKPVALEYGFGDFALTAKGPPALALAGPLVAYAYFDEQCGTCGGFHGLKVMDLRTGRGANGFGPEGDPGLDVFDYGRIRKMVLRRDTALAYIQCGRCKRVHVFKIDSGAPEPVLLAKGARIDPHFLRLRHGRVEWRAAGRVRSAPLR
jgi:hypothetical protein